MNCLEVRRSLAVEPNPRDPAVLDHIAECPNCADAMAQSERFERKLRQAVNIPVPEDLASKVLLRQSFDAPASRSSRWWKWPAALAASVVLAVGVLLSGGLKPLQGSGLDRDVVELVNAAAYALTPVEPLEHDKVKEALRPIGVGLQSRLKDVTFANRCYVRGKLAGHLVIKSGPSPITVFVIPHPMLEEAEAFEGEDWAGQLLPAQGGTIAVVGLPGESLDEVIREVRGALQWKAESGTGNGPAPA